MHQDLRNLRIPPTRSKREKMIAMLNGIRKKDIITSLLLIMIIVVFVWGFGPWQRREATSGAAIARDDVSTAVRAAESFGFTNVRVLQMRHIGGALYPCDENDSVMYDVFAMNIRDKEVPLLLCCSSTNTCTIRTR